NLIELLDESNAAGLEIANDVTVVDDLAADVDRPVECVQGEVHDLDGPNHAGAKAARRSQENLADGAGQGGPSCRSHAETNLIVQPPALPGTPGIPRSRGRRSFCRASAPARTPRRTSCSARPDADRRRCRTAFSPSSRSSLSPFRARRWKQVVQELTLAALPVAGESRFRVLFRKPLHHQTVEDGAHGRARFP